MNQLILKSPAKINLSLKLENRRNDGFHNLKSIVQTINLFDTIKLKKTKSQCLKCCCSDKNLPTNDHNLAVKAAIKFFGVVKKTPKIKIKIIKKIPNQAGLGGASSNAATTLIGLNKLFQTNLSTSTIYEISKKIGADVPFFLFKKTAMMSGFGDIITPLNSISPCYFLILKPKNLSISTKKAFEFYDLKAKNIKTKSETIKQIAKKINNYNNIKTYCELFFNDFEQIFQLEKIIEIKQKLKLSGAICTLMSGSGSCVYGIFENLNNAKKAKKNFKKKEFQKFICKPI